MPTSERGFSTEPSAEHIPQPLDESPPGEPARLDAFISYRRHREDTAFVDQLQEGLTERGKYVWVDRRKIEPAADWSDRILRGIEAAKAFIFVITPESVLSQECLNELDTAARLHKLIIPVVLRDVDRAGLPDSLSRPNWIFFRQGDAAAQALDEVVLALDTDLEWRDAHTRLGVRANEWADSHRDRSFLLRGSDLRLAEEWLSKAPLHAKTTPTAVQAEYVAASREASTRTQRTIRAALSAGLVVAITLAVTALVQRNNAQTAARLAQSRADAAQAVADLSVNPSLSLRYALEATRINPSGQAEQSLRLALAQDRLRMVIRAGTGSATLAAWNLRRTQLAVTAPHDSVALWNSATGRVTQMLPTGHASQVTQLLFDSGGTRLAAVSAAGYVSIWNIASNGRASPVPTSNLNSRIRAATLSGYGGTQGSYAGAWPAPAAVVSKSSATRYRTCLPLTWRPERPPICLRGRSNMAVLSLFCPVRMAPSYLSTAKSSMSERIASCRYRAR